MATRESGDVVVLLDSSDGRVARLVRTAGLVRTHAGVPVALIGGMAVLCRVPGGPQRATQDVDLVSEESTEVVATSGVAADNLVTAKLAQRDPTSASTRLFVGDTKVEIIETMAVTPSEVADVQPERARLFVLAHRWALESATDCTITVVNSDVSETVPVASPAALVAMKLHAIQDRSDARKRASDAWDLYKLLESHNRSGEISHAFAAGPDTLAELAAAALGRVFGTAVTQTRNWVVGFGEPAWRDILTVEALTELAEEFSDYLQ